MLGAMPTHTTSIRIRLQSRLRTVAVFLYGILLVCVVQHFPFARFWLNFMRTAEPNDTPMQAFEGFLFVSQLPAVIQLIKNPRFLRLFRIPGPHYLIMLLFSLLGLSTIWSTMPGRTFWDLAVISMSVMSITYLALKSSVGSFVTTLFIGLQISIAIAYWSIWRQWPDAIQAQSEVWQGIFGNRNTLAPIATVGALSGACVLMQLSKCRYRPISVSLVTVVIALDVNVLFHTKSITNIIALLLATSGLVLVLTLNLTQYRGLISPRTAQRLLLIGLLSLLSVVLLGVTAFSDQISARLGRYSGLSGRFDFWKASWNGILSRPLNGWGWNAAWQSTEFQKDLPAIVKPFLWSHSVWLEFGLGIGLVGLLLGLGWMFLSLGRCLRQGLDEPDGVWLVSFPCFAAVLLSMESMSWIFHWFFAVLVATYLVAEEKHAISQSTFDTL